MTTPIEVARVLFAEPFQPYRINLAGGKSYEICHPDAVDLGLNRLVLYTYFIDGAEGEDVRKKVSLTLVESIEPLESSQGRNGG